MASWDKGTEQQPWKLPPSPDMQGSLWDEGSGFGRGIRNLQRPKPYTLTELEGLHLNRNPKGFSD